MNQKNVLELDDTSFDAAVLSSELPVLVDFGATWCQPCRMLEPIVAALADENAGRLVVAKVDIDASPEVAKRYGIRGAPTLLVFRGGKKVAHHLGLTSKAKLLELAFA
jgi:thioredoxin 1